MKLRKPVVKKIAHAEMRKAVEGWLSENCPGSAWWHDPIDEERDLLDVFVTFILSLRK